MGGVCCAGRDRPADLHPLVEVFRARPSLDLRVVRCGARGLLTLAKREFDAGDLILKESPIALLDTKRDTEWLAALRRALGEKDGARAWVYCLATQCLAAGDLPQTLPEGLRPLSKEEAAQVMDLVADRAAEPPTEMALITAKRLATEPADLARRLDAIAARIEKHGFQASSADALFLDAACVACCAGGAPTATWDFDGGTLTVRALRALAVGDEVTFDAAMRARAAQSAGPCACTTCRPWRGGLPGHAIAALGAAPSDAASAGELPATGKTQGGADASGGTGASCDVGMARRAVIGDLPATEPSAVDEAPTQSSDTMLATRSAVGASGGTGDAPPGSKEASPQVGKAAAEPSAADVAAAQEKERVEKEAARHCRLEALLSKWGDEYIEELEPSEGAEARAQEHEDASAERKLHMPLRKTAGPRPTSSTASPAGSAMGDTPSASTMTGATAQSPTGADSPMSRLMQRCKSEGLEVPRDRAERLLQEHEGHIGRVMILLRRGRGRTAA